MLQKTPGSAERSRGFSSIWMLAELERLPTFAVDLVEVLVSLFIYAVDGHYHKAACFDPKHEASDGAVRAAATGHFFRLNMRTHHLS